MADSQYATVDEFATLAAPPKSLATQVTSAELDALLLSASALADGYIGGRYTLPLATWGQDLKYYVAVIALWFMLGQRAYNPTVNTDSYRARYLDAIKWLESVRDGAVSLPGVPVGSVTSGAYVTTSTARGW